MTQIDIEKPQVTTKRKYGVRDAKSELEITKKDPFKIRWRIILIFSSIFSVGFVMLGYIFFWQEVVQGYSTIENMQLLTLVVSIRIAIMGVLSYFIFHNWLSQKNSYLTDIPFLMGTFFITITFGKSIDLLHNLIHFTAQDKQILFLLKIRYSIIVATAAPLLYLGFGILLIWLASHNPQSSLKSQERRDFLRSRLIIMIIIIECIAIALTPTISLMGLHLPFILMPALLLTAWIFWFSWRNKRLAQVNPPLLFFGFSSYFISSIIRPLLQFIIIGETPTYIIISETIDIVIFIIIFIGLLTKKEYK